MRRSRGSAGGNRGAGAHRTGPCQGRCPPHVQEALPMSVPRPARPRHLVAAVAATLLFAACSYGAGGVSSASSGPVTPAPAAPPASGGCAQAWPPLVVEGAEAATAGAGVSGAIATITRDDGSRQVAYDGHPLYYYAADGKAGDTNGEGVGGFWHVAKP